MYLINDHKYDDNDDDNDDDDDGNKEVQAGVYLHITMMTKKVKVK